MTRGTIRPVQRKTLIYCANIHNRFDVEVIDAATGRLKQKARAYNVICNTLWERLLNVSGTWQPQDYFARVYFGSGSGTPSATDTALFSQLGYKNASNFSVHTSDDDLNAGIAYKQASITLNAEEYVGDTLTEVGIGSTSGITTHAMLEDMNGNPISIEKTATDVITIYATVYLHFPAGGWNNGSVNVVANHRRSFSCLVDILLSNLTLAVRFQAAAGRGNMETTKQASADRVAPTISVSNKTISVTCRLAAGSMNDPIRFMTLDTVYNALSSDHILEGLTFVPGSWFTPPVITGEAVGTGDGSAVGFSTAFPVKTGSKVYVDGVEASGVTFRTGPADVSNINMWLLSVRKTDAGTPAYDAPKAYWEKYRYSTTAISLPDGNFSSAYIDDETRPLENPFCNNIGIAQFLLGNSNSLLLEILASDDLENWTSIGESTATQRDIPAAYQSKRYWKFKRKSGSASTVWYINATVGAAADTAHNIVFSTPPAAGTVITADYTPDCIAKDENHVFDLAVTLALGEYQEA